MWYEIFKFELKYRAKRLDTYIFFLFIFLFSLVAVDFVYGGVDLGLVKRNAPIVIAKTMAVITGTSMMVISMIMGVSVIRDFEYQMESLMFVNPIKKREYLLGRFLGSFVVLLFIFSSVLWGVILGEYMPWRNPEDSLPFNLIMYLQTFLYVVLPLLFFGAALFFVSGALSRKLIVVYTQGIFVFVLFILAKAIDNEFIQAILDPFSFATLSTLTKTWDAAEFNSQLIPFDGVLLYNKLFWLTIGIIALVIGYYRFSFNVVKSKMYKKKSEIIQSKQEVLSEYIKVPTPTLDQGYKAQCTQLIQHSLFYFKSILKEVSFWAIVICGMVIILVNSIGLGTVYGVNSYPATYFIVGELQEMSIFFFIIVLVFYSGELIWKERGARLNLIYDALPLSDFINLAGKFISLLMVYALLMTFLIVSGIIFQTVNGYYHYELHVYFYGFFVELFPFLMWYTFISFFFQVLVNRKFIGYILVMTFFILSMALELFGYGHVLYSFGGNSLGTYSDMNGYGHFLFPYLIILMYWLVFFLILFIITVVFSVRGTDTRLKNRWRLSKLKFTKPLYKLGATAAVIFVLLGGYIFYNTNILNTHWTSSMKEEFKVAYEKTLKKYKYLPQPKIVDINLKLELYPSDRNYSVEGYYMVHNNHKEPIEEIHVQKLLDEQVVLSHMDFGSEAKVNNEYLDFGYTIYKLMEPMQPGDSLKMKFKQTYITKGFKGELTDTKIIDNGTFLKNNDFPSFGYHMGYELRDDDHRTEYGLAPRMSKSKRNDPLEVVHAWDGDDGYEINFEIIIGTAINQTAIAPGTLKKKWVENNRNYFHYKMDSPMINFYAMVSANYEVLKDKWIPENDSVSKEVALEIYYHEGHEYNLSRMMESMKMSLDYFSTNLSPYQYQEMRIMEFPRYAEYAQSFPNTVPFSEGLGFVLDIDDETDVDMAFYITAHELAHQWWGLQVVAANVQGKHFILETLSQYSALMVMRQKYSEEKIQQFLKSELQGYLEGRRGAKKQEASLELVENENYIYYRKGAVNMYALQDYITEDSVNVALKRFIKNWNPFEDSIQKDRYATSEDLLGYFRQVTPDSLQYVITDLFETNTRYVNKTKQSTYEMVSDKQYQVSLSLETIKYRTDSLGVEAVIDMDDWIDIGIYAEGKDREDELIYLKKHRITNKATTLEIMVHQKPTKAGVDTHHKLIDKNSNDNVKILIEKK